MNTATLLINAKKFLRSNNSEILTAFGISGVAVTGYLAVKAGYRSKDRLRYIDEDASLKDKVQIVWDLYIPPVTSGAVTIVCVFSSSKVNNQRTAAVITAYSVAETAFSEYREKIAEEIGPRKEQSIRDKIVQDRIEKRPPSMIIAGSGEVLCCELFTGRYFKSDMESLRRTQNDINHRVVNQIYVTLDEFYDILDLPHTSNSGTIGWESKLLELEFSTVLAPKGEPCLAFRYNYVRSL